MTTDPSRDARSPAVHAALRFLLGLALLVVLDAAGGWLVRATGAPVPGSVIGMLVLTALLETGVLPLAVVRPAAELLVRHLALLYVPAGVALVVYAGAVRNDLLAITAAALASLVAVLLVVGLIVQRLERDA
jgi:holin-like protein